MLGEGAGILILESLERAEKRKAPVYAEIIGAGFSCDAHHMTDPSIVGVSKAILKALTSANLSPNQIDYICAHGTGTIENDRAESLAIQSVFQECDEKIPVSSIKSMLGHSMGAASAIEAISCCLSIRQGEIPPTINFTEKDPACGDIDCVPNQSRKNQLRTALNNSQAFGGNNAVIIIQSLNS